MRGRHSVFKHVPGPVQSGAPTQFSRAMDELGIQMIFALSPQAKGQVERTAGTFQDRLVAELRLTGATTIEEANVVLNASACEQCQERREIRICGGVRKYRPGLACSARMSPCDDRGHRCDDGSGRSSIGYERGLV